MLLFRPSSVILHLFLANLHWLLIDLPVEFKILIITWKTLHGLAPAYIKDLHQSYLPARDLRSSKKSLLAVPAFNINSYGRRAFSVAAPLLWNSLPQHIRDAGSRNIFKRQLKTILFRCAFFKLMTWLWCFHILNYFIFSLCRFFFCGF